jgi:hypothetical protein
MDLFHEPTNPFFVARMQVLAHIRRMSTTVDLMIQKLVQNA